MKYFSSKTFPILLKFWDQSKESKIVKICFWHWKSTQRKNSFTRSLFESNFTMCLLFIILLDPSFWFLKDPVAFQRFWSFSSKSQKEENSFWVLFKISIHDVWWKSLIPTSRVLQNKSRKRALMQRLFIFPLNYRN